MSLTASPYGLVAVQKQGSGYNEGGAARSFVMTTNVTTALYAGAILVLGTNGEVTTPAASPTFATTTPIIGVIVGFEFVDPVMKYQLFDSYLPANAVTSGYTNIRVIVNDDPQQLYKVQATAPVTRAQVGLNAALSNTQAGSAITKRSTSALNAATLAATTNTLRVVDFVIAQDQSTPGDAFTDCIVRFCPTAHAYEKAAGPT
jgi:hypothetical protein